MNKMVGLKTFIIGLVLAGGALLPLATYAFNIEKRNIICQSESETPTEESTGESTEKPKETPEETPEEESPEDDCD